MYMLKIPSSFPQKIRRRHKLLSAKYTWNQSKQSICPYHIDLNLQVRSQQTNYSFN